MVGLFISGSNRVEFLSCYVMTNAINAIFKTMVQVGYKTSANYFNAVISAHMILLLLLIKNDHTRLYCVAYYRRLLNVPGTVLYSFNRCV